MSVVIRGFDKPSDCDYCTLQDDGYCNVLLSYINVEHGIDTRCPITEISGYILPNGHKVVVADTPQTDCGKPIECEGCGEHICIGCEHQAKKEAWRKAQTDCGWK